VLEGGRIQFEIGGKKKAPKGQRRQATGLSLRSKNTGGRKSGLGTNRTLVPVHNEGGLSDPLEEERKKE